MNELLLAIILSLLPISELRGGLPVAIDYALKNNTGIVEASDIAVPIEGTCYSDSDNLKMI